MTTVLVHLKMPIKHLSIWLYCFIVFITSSFLIIIFENSSIALSFIICLVLLLLFFNCLQFYLSSFDCERLIHIFLII